jgi:hypothetical protein
MPFVPIQVDEYIDRFQRANPGSNATELRRRLQETLQAFRDNARCACGERIWVLGSAEVGLACFTCITGEAEATADFELEEACIDRSTDGAHLPPS